MKRWDINNPAGTPLYNPKDYDTDRDRELSKLADDINNKHIKELMKIHNGQKTKPPKKSYYKPVAGRRKLPEGKKARAENKGSTEFEMELVHYLQKKLEHDGKQGHAFRSPASKTPVDVWVIENEMEAAFWASLVRVHQCKTTKDTKPPKINKKEFEDFRIFAAKINAKPYWVDRWKKNKNVYIRRIRGIDISGDLYPYIDDFSQSVIL